MFETRAIFIGDVRFDRCPVFLLDEKTNEFVMLTDEEFRYSKEIVEDDPDFLIFKLEKGVIYKGWSECSCPRP